MRKKILVIDDEINIAETLADILELKGYEVKTASDGKAGFSLALEEKPDLILCDVMMPRMTGYEVLEAIRQHRQTRLVPFVFLTAKGHSQDFRLGMDLGADDYLIKPVESNALFHVIENRLNKHNSLLETGHTEENERVSKDLHDTLQQTLLGLQMKLGHFRDKVSGSVDVTALDESLNYIKLAFSQLRMILENADNSLPGVHFESGLDQMIQRVSRYVDFEIRVQNELLHEIPKEKARILFKIVLEVLNNTIKHARASVLTISLAENGSMASLVISDDGCGFDPKKTPEGNGLKNIRERTEKLDGQIQIHSAPGDGTTIEITFEYNQS